MSWNYRVIRHKNDQEEWFNIHEVYYRNDKPVSITENSCAPFGSSKEELRADFELMLKAFDKEVLDYSDFDDEEDDEPNS